MTEKNLILSSNNDNLQEEVSFKDKQIKKLEEDLIGLINEFNEIEINNQKIQTPLETSSRDYDREIRTLIEEKNHVVKDNLMLSLKIERLEKIENEIKTKYISKIE